MPATSQNRRTDAYEAITLFARHASHAVNTVMDFYTPDTLGVRFHKTLRENAYLCTTKTYYEGTDEIQTTIKTPTPHLAAFSPQKDFCIYTLYSPDHANPTAGLRRAGYQPDEFHVLRYPDDFDPDGTIFSPKRDEIIRKLAKQLIDPVLTMKSGIGPVPSWPLIANMLKGMMRDASSRPDDFLPPSSGPAPLR